MARTLLLKNADILVTMDGDRREIEKSLERTRRALSGSDVDALRLAVDELSTLSYQMTETLYAKLGGDEAAE